MRQMPVHNAKLSQVCIKAHLVSLRSIVSYYLCYAIRIDFSYSLVIFRSKRLILIGETAESLIPPKETFDPETA